MMNYGEHKLQDLIYYRDSIVKRIQQDKEELARINGHIDEREKAQEPQAKTG